MILARIGIALVIITEFIWLIVEIKKYKKL